MRRSGTLHGLTIAIKDAVYTQGVRTTAGSRILRNFVPDFDAFVVNEIKQNGGIMVGKTNLHEFCAGPTSTSSAFGPTRNPNNPKLITGGSSGGSAGTVGMGDVEVAIGTDTGGSVRIPAAFCGVIGFKPTYGRISRYGVIPLAWSLDSVGIFARNVETLELVYKLLAHYDSRDPTTIINESTHQDKSKIKTIGIIKELTQDIEVEKEFSHFVNLMSRYFQVTCISLPQIESLAKARTIIRGAEMAAYHATMVVKNSAKYSRDVLNMIKQGLSFNASDYVNAQRVRAQLGREILQSFQKYDFLITPTVPVYPPRIDDVIGKEDKWRPVLNRNTFVVNMIGAPAISIPISKFVGAQLIGNIGDDHAIIDFVKKLSPEIPYFRALNEN